MTGVVTSVVVDGPSPAPVDAVTEIVNVVFDLTTFSNVYVLSVTATLTPGEDETLKRDMKRFVTPHHRISFARFKLLG